MQSVKPANMLFFLLSILIATSITLSIGNRQQESPVKQYDLELPQLKIDGTDGDIGQWIMPAIMKGEKLGQSFIENNVYISQLHATATDELDTLQFTIFYQSDQGPVIRSYQLRYFGKMFINDDVIVKGHASLVPVTAFIHSFNALDRDEVSTAYGIQRLSFAQVNSISRLEEAEIAPDTTVVADGKLAPFGDLRSNDYNAVCYITLAGTGGGAQIPFLFSI